MNQTLKIVLIVLGIIVVVGGLFGAGLFVGRTTGFLGSWGPAAMMQNWSNVGPGMMGGWTNNNAPGQQDNWNGPRNNGNGRQNFGPDFDGRGRGTMGPGRGMMGGLFGQNWGDQNTNVEPLTVDEAKTAVEDYLKTLKNDDLVIGEVMVFDNNAYARIVEKSTGIGAMELLVNPVNKSVIPEPGPNHMWNLKYGMMMTGYGRGPRFGNVDTQTEPADVTATMPVTEQEAKEAAQQYLDKNISGAMVSDEVEAFYGYYTLDYMKDGKVAGMLSVNGFNKAVFLHTWHGDFVEMSESE